MKGWVAIVLVGCAPVLGIEDLKRAEDASVDTGPKPIEYASAECRTCIASSCSNETAKCEAIPACRSMAGCLARCAPSDIKCRSDCEGADPETDASATFRALDDCRRGKCLRECIGLGGAASLLGEACSCIDTKCAKEMTECIRIGGCERYAQCLTHLGYNPSSAMQCRTRERDGFLASGPLGTCVLTAACEGCSFVGGGDYRCVGKYIWEKPSKPEASFKAKVTEFGSSNPVPGTKITACVPAQCGTCKEGAPDSVTTTLLADSIATFALKTPFNGCFRLTNGDKYADFLTYLGRPVVRDEDSWALAMFVRDNLKPLVVFSGVTLVRDSGRIAVYTVDCVMNTSSGVHLDVAPRLPETRVVYFVKGAPDAEGPGERKATDPSGTAAILNAPTGLVMVKSFVGERQVGATPIYVRPDPSETEITTISGVTMIPSETPL
jgi:hypothetical protein